MNIQIKPFTQEYSDKCADLLQYLWKEGSEERKKHFHWEYIENPNSKDKNLSVIAVDDNDNVIGFRGCYINSFIVNDSKQKIAFMADTVVLPSFRKHGIFRKMTEYAFVYLHANSVNVICNLTPSWPACLGNKKLGFVDLSEFKSVYKWGFISLLQKRIFTKERSLDIQMLTGKLSNSIVVIDKVLPNAVIDSLKNKECNEKIASIKDSENILWRSKNPNSNYLYVYTLDENNEVDVFFWFKTSDNYIFHLGYFFASDRKKAKQAIKFFMKKIRPAAVAAWSFALANDERALLSFLGFNSIPFISKIRKNPPVIVRSLQKNEKKEIDWIVNGLDIRDVNNWALSKFDGDSF